MSKNNDTSEYRSGHKGGKLLLDSMVLGLENVASEYGGKYLKLNFKEV